MLCFNFDISTYLVRNSEKLNLDRTQTHLILKKLRHLQGTMISVGVLRPEERKEGKSF